MRRSMAFLAVTGLGLWLAAAVPALAASTWTVVPSPNVSQQATNAPHVSASTTRYRGEIGARHWAHFPRCQSQVTIGRFRCHGIRMPQCGQCDGGEKTLSSRGIR